MSTVSKSSDSLSQIELVYQKISEKRLFEARFLFGKISSSIDYEIRLKLHNKISAAIAPADHMFQKGAKLELAGKSAAAKKTYARVADIAVDYPSLENTLKKVEKSVPLESLATKPDNFANHSILLVDPSVHTETDRIQHKRKRSSGKKKIFFLSISILAVGILTVGIFVLFHPEMLETLLIDKNLEVLYRDKSSIKDFDTSGNVSTFSRIDEAENDISRKSIEETMTESVEQKALPAHQKIEKQYDNLDQTSLGELIDSTASIIIFPGMEEESLPEISKKNSGDSQQIYVVQVGDTLESIAGKLYGKPEIWSGLAHVNKGRLDPLSSLFIGMELVVPPLAELENLNIGEALGQDGIYTVQSGDTLGIIAEKVYGLRQEWKKLYELNRDRLYSPTVLQVGQQLLTRAKSEPAAPASKTGVAETQEVKRKVLSEVKPTLSRSSVSGIRIFEDIDDSGDPVVDTKKQHASSVDPSADSQADEEADAPDKNSDVRIPPEEQVTDLTYVVQKGDTPLESIAGDVLNHDGIYIVQSGDTLAIIAEKVYGSRLEWRKLYKLNRDRLTSPTLLQVGQQLRTGK